MSLTLADGGWMLTAQFLRQGDDLWLRGPQGEQAFIDGYFAADKPAALGSEDDADVRAEWADVLEDAKDDR